MKSLSPEEAQSHFGWLAMFAAHDLQASSAKTRKKLGWNPTGPGLIADLEQMRYFETDASVASTALWDTLVCYSSDLYPEQLLDDIKQAYEDGLVDPVYLDFDDVKNATSRWARNGFSPGLATIPTGASWTIQWPRWDGERVFRKAAGTA